VEPRKDKSKNPSREALVHSTTLEERGWMNQGRERDGFVCMCVCVCVFVDEERGRGRKKKKKEKEKENRWDKGKKECEALGGHSLPTSKKRRIPHFAVVMWITDNLATYYFLPNSRGNLPLTPQHLLSDCQYQIPLCFQDNKS
jgi:hypothetical protein